MEQLVTIRKAKQNLLNEWNGAGHILVTDESRF
jgi:hypothetical protein